MSVHERAQSPPNEPRRFHILVVEDDDLSRELVRQILADAGYDVHLAKNGVDALAIVDRTPIHVAVVDLNMPRMGGQEFCEKLRQRRGGGEVRVIILSAVDVLSVQLQALKAGASDFMAKPVDETVLLHKVQSFVTHIELQEQLKRRVGKR
ncbi:MAG: hypothetical protein NVS3B20_22630 [Polyangiales bacterium]